MSQFFLLLCTFRENNLFVLFPFGMKKILMVLAEIDFRDSEYIVPQALWHQFRFDVHTTSSSLKSVGRYGYEVFHDFLISEAKEAEFDALFFVGGNGCLAFLENKDAKQLADDFSTAQKPIGAICAAPRLLLHWGLLHQKKCTGYNGDQQFPKLCEHAGAFFENAPVVVDQNICTGTGPSAAEQTAIAFGRMLQ
jgi:putative intracellular protease/amidase